MQISTDAFDRDLCLFEATRLLSLDKKMESADSKFVNTRERTEVSRHFPLLYRELAKWLDEGQEFILHIFKEKPGPALEDQPVLQVRGPARVFIFSSASGASLSAGTVVTLEESDSLTLLYRDFRNHFAGIVR